MRSSYAPATKYTGTGHVSDYEFAFKIEELTHLLVVVIDDNDVEVERVRGDDTVFISTVTFDATLGGGMVTLAAALPTGYVMWLLLANDEPTQARSYKELFTFTLQGFEMALDFIVGPIQRLAWQAGRTLRFHDAQEGAFDGQLPLNPTPGTTIIVGADGLSLAEGPSENDLTDAAAAVISAQAAQAAAEAAQAAAENSETAALAAVTAAEAAENGALSAQAAAEAAAASITSLFIKTGPFTVNENTNQDLSGELFSSVTYNQIDFVSRIMRSTGVFSRQEFSIFYRNSAWELVTGFERLHENALTNDVTFTVNSTTGQINAAVPNDGKGDATITLLKTQWTIT